MMMLRILLVFLALHSAALAASDWIKFEKSTHEAGEYFDGDSFQVRTEGATRGYTYVFRLYGADCPETDARYIERNDVQADDFKIPPDEVIRWGIKAKEFAAEFLSRPFTVETRKDKARGSSGQNRYYAIVTGADGRDLAESLVRAGLARAFGFWPSELPNGADGTRYRRALERAESQARTDGIGIWSKGREEKESSSFFKSKLPFE